MKKLYLFVAIFAVVAVLSTSLGCAKPAPAPKPSPTPAATPAPAPTSTLAPTAKPTPTAAALQLPKSIKMAGGQEGSSLYVQAVGVSDTVQKFLGITVGVTPNAGTQQIMETILKGEPDIAMMSSMHARVGFVGSVGYSGFAQYEKMGPIPVRTLVLGSLAPMGALVRGDIYKLSDLKGKKILGNNLASEGNLKQTMGILEIAGLSLKDVTILDMPTSAIGLQWFGEGKADATVGDLGGANIVAIESKLGTQARVLALPIDEASMKLYNKHYPGLAAYTSAGVPFMPKGTTTFAIVTFLASRAGVSDDVAYAVTKVVLEHTAELTAIQKVLAAWNIQNTVSIPSFAPFHPGAIKYLKEKGVWTAGLQAHQDELLSLEAKAKATWKAPAK